MKQNYDFKIDKIKDLSSEEISLRKKNLDLFYQTGFPNKKDEDWKFSDLNSILSNNFNKIANNDFLPREKEFKIIDALYLRLGYYLLVEWGHTHYLNNSGQLVQAEFLTPAYNTFFGTGTGNEILGNINASRQESFGNYDGGLVMVNNFTW